MAKRKRFSSSVQKPANPNLPGLPQVSIPFLLLPRLLTVKSFLQKKHYSQRAHANPFSDHALDYPESPHTVNWDSHYPAFANTGRTPTFADVGCGFGGLLITLASLLPDTLILG